MTFGMTTQTRCDMARMWVEPSHGVSSGTSVMAGAQRFGIQLPRARCTRRVQKPHDLAREAVNCNAVLGRAAFIGVFHFSMAGLLRCPMELGDTRHADQYESCSKPLYRL